MSWFAAGAAVVSAGVGVYKTVKSSHDEKKAREEQSRLAKPFYQIQDEYYKNQQLAQGLATQGYTTAAKNYLTEESGRGLGSGISAIENTGGNANDISKLYSVYQNSLRTTAAGDAQQQIENIKNLMAVNKDIAGQKTTKWSLDTDREYQNKMKELKLRQQIDNQNKWNGISEAIGSAGAAGTAFSNSNLIPKGTNTSAGTPGLMSDRGNDSLAVAPVTTEQAPQATVPGLQESSWNQFFGQHYN